MEGKKIVSSDRDVFSLSSESRAKIYKATGGTAAQMERREDVSLIDAAEREGVGGRVGWRWRWWSLSNSAKITDTSAVHLHRSHQACIISCPPCKVDRAATAGWRVSHKRRPLRFSSLSHQLPKRAWKEKAAHSTG